MGRREIWRDSRFGPSKPQGFFTAIFHLIGHVLGGAVLFLSVACVTWGLGYAIEWMNKIHAFPEAILKLLHGFEFALLCADVVLSGTVILYGLWQFLKHLGGSQHE